MQKSFSALLVTASLLTCFSVFGESSRAEVVPELVNEHPAAFYEHAAEQWGSGLRDEALFWFYVGQLRYRFHLSVDPGEDPSGDPALFSALQAQVGDPINRYGGSDIDNWVRVIDRVLQWDEANPNGYTSKSDHHAEWTETRAGLRELRDELLAQRDAIVAEREQAGIGETGVIDGVYVEEQMEKMPLDWPALVEVTDLDMLVGKYEGGSRAMLGPIFFFDEQQVARRADSFELKASPEGDLIVVAWKDGDPLLQKQIPVRLKEGAVVFEEKPNLSQVGLKEGVARRVKFLRLNVDNELVVQRESFEEGRDMNGFPVRYSFRFWNRAKRQSSGP